MSTKGTMGSIGMRMLAKVDVDALLRKLINRQGTWGAREGYEMQETIISQGWRATITISVEKVDNK